MNEIRLPLKNVAVALLFCAFLGPVGLLYSSTIAGIVMILLGFFVIHQNFIGLFILIWLISCVLGVSLANRFNKKMVQSQK